MKKFLVRKMMVVAVLLCAACLTGCGGKSSKTLKWVQLGDKQPNADVILEEANKIIEPELGMKLEIEYIDTASFNEKSKMKMASGEDFDLIWTGYLNDYQTAVSMEGLMDITDYLDDIKMSDGKTVKMSDVISDYYFEAAKVNGRIYGIPNMQVNSNPFTLQLRKSVADECNLDLEGLQKLAVGIKDAETSKAYLEKLTAEFEKVHNKMPDLYTFNPGTNMAFKNIYEEIIGGVGIKKDGSSSDVYIINDTEEFKIGVDAAYDWFNKGYTRSDIASKGNAITSVDEKKQYAILQDTWKPGQSITDSKEFGEDIVYSWFENPYISRTNPLATMLSVGANAKHPEEAVKFIYMINSNKDLYNLFIWGIEGKDYKLNEDGTATEIEKTGYDEMNGNAWRFGNQFNAIIESGMPENVWELTKEMNDKASVSPAMGFVPNTEDITTEIANITNVNAEYKAKIEFGTAPRSEYWDEYMSKLKAAGIEKVRDEIQKQYDEFLSKK